MKQLILLRHGQSQWNLENKFTGWTDVPLSDKGREEARSAGRLMAKNGINPKFLFTSYLKRAIDTLDEAIAEMDLEYLPVVKDWHLNERHYGALQGLNKAEVAKQVGDEQVHIWRRSYDVRPPQLTKDDPRYPGKDIRYSALTENELPLGESLEDTIKRVHCCWEECIAPKLHNLDTVLIVAHGNSLRGLAMMLKHISPEEVVSLEIPTGQPWVFETDDRLTPLRDYFLK